MTMKNRTALGTAAGLLAAVFLLSCASTGPPPVDTISNAEMVIRRARQNEADKYAPLQIKLAEEKLEKAKAAMDEEAYDKARRIAEEALADAQVAEATAKAKKQKKIADEMEESVDTLRQEIDRKQ